MSTTEEERDRLKAAMDAVDMDYVKEAEGVYNELMVSYPLALAKSTSKKEREDRQMLKNGNVVYGEIVFETMGIVLEKIKKYYGRPNVGSSGSEGVLQSKGGSFYDLGSGKLA